MKKTLTLLLAIITLCVSCKEEEVDPIIGSYLGRLSNEYVAELGILEIESETEQIEVATVTLENIFRENGIEVWQDLEMYNFNDNFFWFTVSLSEADFSKLINENRMTIGINGETSI